MGWFPPFSNFQRLYVPIPYEKRCKIYHPVPAVQVEAHVLSYEIALKDTTIAKTLPNEA